MHLFRSGLRAIATQVKTASKLNTKSAYSTASTAEKIEHRNDLFDIEQKRQQQLVGRVEKIEVRYLGLPEDVTLIMNKGISTPYNCAQHLTDLHCKKSVLALVDGKLPWDIHTPLQDTCTLQLLRFDDADPHLANKTFWRSCSFMLGAVLSNAFKDNIHVNLHSFPTPSIRSGSFVYDISLNQKNWQPSGLDRRSLSAEMVKLAARELKFERLEVVHDVAYEMFKDNPYKREQLPSISRDGSVVLYRIGNHIDISRGPMMSGTHHLGRVSITSVHQIQDEIDGCTLYRVQGVALPKDFVINHFAYNILEKRSENLNPARLPNQPFDSSVLPKGKMIA